VVGRIFDRSEAMPEGRRSYGQHEDRSPTHGHEPTREAAMAAMAKSWGREQGAVYVAIPVLRFHLALPAFAFRSPAVRLQPN